MLEMDPAIAVLGKRHDAFARQAIPGTNDWVARKRKFVARCKYPQATQCFFFFRGEDENRFRQIHLASDLLHPLVGDSFGFRKNRQRIPAKGPIGEYIQLNESIIHHASATCYQEEDGSSGTRTCWSSGDKRFDLRTLSSIAGPTPQNHNQGQGHD